ncbi:hypothetical protein NDU88_013117 [Pleurodeles waltl]|uniref:Uncharacterized protein n=1 Tax=Pleurodeles waltl TaxID=8319 RepID=A0AAV7R3T2_PLEWA|nr:hypothetical protein NDU88_013117 [Pleurodeles waltl]
MLAHLRLHGMPGHGLKGMLQGYAARWHTYACLACLGTASRVCCTLAHLRLPGMPGHGLKGLLHAGTPTSAWHARARPQGSAARWHTYMPGHSLKGMLHAGTPTPAWAQEAH